MTIGQLPIIRWLGVRYTPRPDERLFLDRAQAQQEGEVEVKVAVLSSRESDRFFGAPLARRGIQPVWLEISNRTDGPLFFDRVHLDPNYYPPLEAALVNHFAIGKRLAGFGALAWVFLPLLVFLPLKLLGARRANRRMDVPRACPAPDSQEHRGQTLVEEDGTSRLAELMAGVKD